jgi:hypothetical protein
MTTALLMLAFTLFMTFVVPIIVGVMIWRFVRRVLKNAGVPGNAMEIAKLRDLIAQARGQQARGHPPQAQSVQAGSVIITAAPAARAPLPPAILVKSLGSGMSVIAIVFSLIGGISGAVAVVMSAAQLDFLSNVVRAPGEVVRNVRQGSNKSGVRPVVRFQDETGATFEFTAPIGNSPAQFDVGEAVTVVYPPGEPDEAKIDNWLQLWFGPMLSGFFVLVFGGIGIGFLIPFLRQRLRARWAREHGAQVHAKFSGVEHDRTTRINGRSPYKVFADWRNPVDGKLYRFQSQKVLWFDPTAQLSQRPDLPMRVDPQQPKRYWLDVSHLKSS